MICKKQHIQTFYFYLFNFLQLELMKERPCAVWLLHNGFILLCRRDLPLYYDSVFQLLLENVTETN